MEEIFETVKSILSLDKLELPSFTNSDKYLKKCNLSIQLLNNCFIPYYLRAICKIFSEEEETDILEDIKYSYELIGKEIQRYIYIYNFIKNEN